MVALTLKVDILEKVHKPKSISSITKQLMALLQHMHARKLLWVTLKMFHRQEAQKDGTTWCESL